MFRSVKKRPQQQQRKVVRLLDQDDEEEESPPPAVALPSKRKANRRVLPSFGTPGTSAAAAEFVDDEDDSSRKKKPKKKKGLGYGGNHHHHWHDTTATADAAQVQDSNVASSSTHSTIPYCYDKASLSQLASEQHRYVLPDNQDEQQQQQPQPPPISYNLQQPQPQPQPQFQLHAAVLTGEEAERALAAAAAAQQAQAAAAAAPQQQQQQERVDSYMLWEGQQQQQPELYQQPEPEPPEPPMEQQEAVLSDKWEAHVSRRAGILPTTTTATNNITTNTNTSTSTSIQQLGDQVRTTLEQVQLQQDDLNRAQQRRQVELEQTQQEQQRQEGELHESGQAVEYYQQLRAVLANWVGALRQLNKKVQPLLQALHELEGQVAAVSRQRQHENDMIAVLFQYNRLDQVLGRQINDDPSILETDAVNYYIAPQQQQEQQQQQQQLSKARRSADEFGRDIQSHHSLQRDKRARQRKRIQQQRPGGVRGDESDAYLSDDEKESFRERHVSLQAALDVALQEMEEEFTSLSNLVCVFEQWKERYPEEYKQCFASLSLADLASVLIKTELCSLNDPWDESEGYNEGKWIAVVHSALEPSVLDQAGVERIMEKSVVPAIFDLLDKSGYNLVSKRQTRTLSQFWKHLQKIFQTTTMHNNSPSLDKLSGRLIEYIRAYLSDMAIPIVTHSSSSSSSASDYCEEEALSHNEELADAIEGATVGQMHRIKKILLNLITYWAPVFVGDDNKAFAQVVLDFMSNKLLFLLSSLQGFPQPRFAEYPGDVFRHVWEALRSQTPGWLDSSDWMLQAAPLRAAAAVYIQQ